MHRRRLTTVTLAVGVIALTAACSSNGGFGSSSSSGAGASATPNNKPLTLMFGSSGPAETSAVKAAAAAFSRQSGIAVQVIPASNLTQQLAQGFAGNEPPDVFYLDPLSFQNYAKDGVLAAYAPEMPNAAGFSPVLKQTFSYRGQFVCAPKDASTDALYVNTQDWQQAGLGAPPANWSQLQADAKKLTTAGRTGLVLDNSESGIDMFLYQNGGSVQDSAGNVVLDSPQNVRALTFVKSMLTSGIMKFPPQLNAGFSGQAFGENKAAMVITGPWENGTLSADYPKVKFKVYPLPAGPTGVHATLSFTNCWGVPKSSKNLAGATALVKFLTTPQQEMKFSSAFGVIPSLSAAQTDYINRYPQYAAFVNELSYAHPDIAIAKGTQAITAYSSALAQLGSSSPASILKTAQQNLQAVVDSDK